MLAPVGLPLTFTLGAFVRATVQLINSAGTYSAKTENNILVVFSIVGSEKLPLGTELEVDLPSLLKTQTVFRVQDGLAIAITINENDIHDLNLPSAHGTSRTPSLDRMQRT